MTPQELFQWCIDHKNEIEADAMQDFSPAKCLISAHQLMVARPDQGALSILYAAVEEYQKLKPSWTPTTPSQ